MFKTMPPKQEIPDLIFVSESRIGAMTHHTRIDDIVGLVFDHLKASVMMKKVDDPFFYFALFAIDCTPNLHFTKKSMIFSHDELKTMFDDTEIEHISPDDVGVTDLEEEIEKKMKETKKTILPKIKDLVISYLEHFFSN